MYSRPGRDENEEDLLRIQREFLSGGGNPAASVSQRLEPSGDFDEDNSCEKRPHERDVVQLRGNENVEVFPNPPRKKSKFKDRHSSLQSKQQQKDRSGQVDVDGAELLESDDQHVTVLLSKIMERDTRTSPIVMPSVTPKGFPTVLHRNTVEMSGSEEQSNSRQSVFAKQFAKSEEKDFGISTRQQPAIRCDDGDIDEDMIDDDSDFFLPTLITGEGLQSTDAAQQSATMAEVRRIHEENMKKLASMSEEEILEEQAKVRQMLDPSILKFLQEKRKQQEPASMSGNDPQICEDDEGIDSNLVDDVTSGDTQEEPGSQGDIGGLVDVAKDILGGDISENWLHMDQVEPEKLEWMKKAPSVQKSGTNEQARFNFEGSILVGSENIPEHLGLHHHGQEPGRAGYTLEELFLLSRSNFLQQRVLAINILARILEKDRSGGYRDQLDQDLLPSLLEAGLPFLLRWSLDEPTDSLIAASVSCFTALLVKKNDEATADLLCFGWYRGKELPCLCPAVMEAKDSDDDASNSPDVDIVKQDLIKGLLQMRFLPRLRYILEVCRPSSPVVLDVLDILIAIARHSTEAAHSVAKCPRLLETILVQFLPSSWKARERSVTVSDVYGYPLAKALKVLRVLCCAGKYLADILVTKFDLITKVLRFITVPADQMMLDVTEALELAAESLTIWSTCVSYGLACVQFSKVYSHILTQVQGLALLPVHDQCSPSTICASALVDLIEAVTHVAGSKAELQAQLTTQLAKDKTPSGMDASHLPPSPIDWSHVTGLLPVIGQCVRLFKEQFVSLEESVAKEESFFLLSRVFNLLASFYQKLVTQPFYSPVECLEEIEKFLMTEICVPIMESKTMAVLLDKMRDYTSYYASEILVIGQSHVSSLPDYGSPLGQSCSNQSGLPRCLLKGTPFPFLLSFARLSMVITSCHKGLTSKFLKFVTNDIIVQYLKSNSTPGQNNCESQCFFVKVEQHFQYFLIKLFYNILLQNGGMNGQLTALYHTTSLLLFSRLFPGDEFYAHDLMSTVLFNSAFFHESKEECATGITSNMSEMGIGSTVVADNVISTKQNSFSRGELLSEAYKDLLSIRSTFISSFAQMRHALAKSRARSLHQPQNITSFLLPLLDGTMLPADWMFMPLVDLHNTAVKSELTLKPQQYRLSSASTSVVKRTLQWVLLLEEWRPVVLHKVPCTAKIARLMCTFLTGSDLFLDNLIHNYLKSLLHSYTHSSLFADLDFNSPVPGITSFYDLYISFVVQYEAVSYGDALFSAFLLLPLQQRYNDTFRKVVWNEHTGVFRSFGLAFDELPVRIEYYLFPGETSFEILTLQLRALATGVLRQSWSPVFYVIAVHHLSTYIFTKPEDMNSFNQKFKLMNQVLLLNDQDVKNDIICYHKPSPDSPKGFQKFSSLPPTRERLLRNKDEPEEAWRVWYRTT